MTQGAQIALNDRQFRELYERSRAAELGLSEAAWRATLSAIAEKYEISASEASAFWRSLRLEDLALARACAEGNEQAWTEFLNRFRVKLYDTARSITRQESSARELADGIYAELYGLSEKEGVRRSKLLHYSGRGSLEGWLRTVLAQEWVNRYRKGKRETSLEEQEEAGMQFKAATSVTPTASGAPIAHAVDETLRDLPAEDRYVLASYFLDGRKLAEIARTLGVHESTISRRVEKITVGLRSSLLARLRNSGMSQRQAEEALETDVRDLEVGVRASLQRQTAEKMQADAAGAFSKGEERK